MSEGPIVSDPEGPAERVRPGTERHPGRPASGRTLNTGRPAATPPGTSPWDDPDRASPSQPTTDPLRPPPGFGYQPPDLAVAAGPPWPVLVAGPGYQPPELIKWPIAVGALAVIVYLAVVVLLPPTRSANAQQRWLADHGSIVRTLGSDLQAVLADTDHHTARPVQIAAWQTFLRDAETASTLPNPGGSATAPWREMINDYVVGAQAEIQSLSGPDPAALAPASRDFTAAAAAAGQFDQAMGEATGSLK